MKLIFTVAVLLFLRCDGFIGEARLIDRQLDPGAVVGQWRSEPYDTQLGRTVEDLCLSSDGKVKIRSNTQAGKLENDGTYRLVGDHGDQLIFQWPSTDSSAVCEVSVGAGKLDLKYEDGTITSYRRVGKKCTI